MRVTWGVLALLAACNFDPSQQRASVDGDVDDAAASIDGSGVDAAALDALATVDGAVVDAATVDASVDAAPPIDGRPSCPASYATTYAGSAYRFVPVAAVWSTAAADCENDLAGRTHLATFENPEEMDPAIDAVNPGNSAQVHVGASCSPNAQTSCSSPGSWRWVTNQLVAAILWDAGEPNNGIVETVALAFRQSGRWVLNNVSPAIATRPYICECEP